MSQSITGTVSFIQGKVSRNKEHGKFISSNHIDIFGSQWNFIGRTVAKDCHDAKGRQASQGCWRRESQARDISHVLFYTPDDIPRCPSGRPGVLVA